MSTLELQALHFKEEGNKLLKAGKDLAEVVSYYSKGLSILKKSDTTNADQNKIKVDLLNNRAGVYSLMARFESAKMDAESALQIDQENLKSMLRLVKAAIMMKHYVTVIDKCELAEQILNQSGGSTQIDSLEIFRDVKKKAQADQLKSSLIKQAFEKLNENNTEAFKQILDPITDGLYISLACDPYGDSLLSIASRNGNLEIVKYLIEEKHVFKNMQNYRGASAIYGAAFSGCANVVEYLMSIHADPTPPSSFTGLKAHEVCGDTQLKAKLTKYYRDYEKIKQDPVFNFKYRMAEYWRENMFYHRHPNCEGYFQGFVIFPKVREIVSKSLDLCELLKTVEQKEEEFEVFFTENKSSSGHLESGECLLCNEKIDNCSKCGFCGKVNICAKCQNTTNQSIILMKTIHQNNCKSKMYF